MFNLLQLTERQRLIDQIESEPNKARKQWSLRQFEIQSGRLDQYVKESLQSQYSFESVREMPIVSSINVQKRMVDKKAVIYNHPPERHFTNLSEEQEGTLKDIYKDMKANIKLGQANKSYTYQDQVIGMIVPKNKKLIMRVFKMHQIDAIIDEQDPESSDGFIISTFDRTNYVQLYQDKKERDVATGVSGRSVRSTASQSAGDDLDVGNEYQFRRYVQKYVVWTPEYNFTMNGVGEILDPETGEPLAGVTVDDIKSPLAEFGIMPFFEVAREKDFEYFVRASNSLTDFTIQFNVSLSDLANNIKMNGYSVAILKAPSELQPDTQVIGPAMLLKLPTDDPEKEVDFSFASPNSSIGEISDANDKFLNYFITTEGLGSETINSQGSTEKYASGLDRFISMIDRLEASKDDYEAFKDGENQIFEIIKAWLTVLKGDEALDKKYQMSLPEDCNLSIDFHKPEMVMTETEKLDLIERKIDARLMSRLSAIKELHNIDDDEKAMEILKEIDDMEFVDGEITQGQPQGNTFRNQAGNRLRALPEEEADKE